MARKDDIKEIDRIVNDLGLTKEQRRLLHQAITGQGLTNEEIVIVAREIKEDYPNK